jgi:hypothetical protein
LYRKGELDGIFHHLFDIKVDFVKMTISTSKTLHFFLLFFIYQHCVALTVQYTLNYTRGTRGYQLIKYTDVMSWSSAMQIATNLNGQLASFETSNEYIAVFNGLISGVVNPSGWPRSGNVAGLYWAIGPFIGGESSKSNELFRLENRKCSAA